jgi:hypothetical protein
MEKRTLADQAWTFGVERPVRKQDIAGLHVVARLEKFAARRKAKMPRADSQPIESRRQGFEEAFGELGRIIPRTIVFVLRFSIVILVVDLCCCPAGRELNDDSSYLRDERETLNN